MRIWRFLKPIALAIQDWFRNEGKEALQEIQTAIPIDGKHMTEDFRQFDGNAQTLRLLCKLQVLLDAVGLNLTCGTLSACRKYVGNSTEIDSQNRQLKKIGYFWSEQKEISEVEEATGT